MNIITEEVVDDCAMKFVRVVDKRYWWSIIGNLHAPGLSRMAY